MTSLIRPHPLLRLHTLRINWHLIGQLTRRDVSAKYRGSLFGLAWSFITPLLMLCVYAFVFSFIFKARWGNRANENQLDFALLLFIGLLIHGFLSECLTRAPLLIVQHANYVKKVVFPLEVLPVSAMLSALTQFCIGSAIMLVFVAVAHDGLPFTVLFYPLVIAPFVVLMLGVVWVISSLGVFVRDLAQATGLFSTILMFLSPVFYPITALPEQWRPLFQLNPLTFIIEEARAVVFWGQAPNWTGLVFYFAVATLVCGLGLAWFQRTRHAFADVL